MTGIRKGALSYVSGLMCANSTSNDAWPSSKTDRLSNFAKLVSQPEVVPVVLKWRVRTLGTWFTSEVTGTRWQSGKFC